MRKVLPLFLIVFSSSLSHAQWSTQASGFPVASRGIDQIVIVDQYVAWATAYDGSGSADTVQDFTMTTDGGTWTAGTVTGVPSYYAWSCIAAVSSTTAWAMFFDEAAGATGAIYKTTDGGQTWDQESAGFNGSSSFPDVIYFWDENNGVAVGDPVSGEYEIYTSTDGGDNWNAVNGANIPNPLNGEYAYTRGLSVSKDGTLWFGTNKGRVYKTTDMGATWTVSSTGVALVENITARDENTSWVRRLGILKRTTDGGANWTDVTPTSGHFFQANLAYVPFTAGTLVSTGSNYQTGDYGSSYSLDGGDNWVTIDSAVQHIAVAFFDNVIGWSGGFNTDQYTDGIYQYVGAFVTDGIAGTTIPLKFNLYPNPSNGLFYFSFDASNNNPIHICVMDAIGKKVFDKVYKDKSQTWLRSIDLRNFSKGIYFLDLENNGNHTAQKLVIN